MRAIWSGTIAFGLVNVPVKAYSAIDDHDVSLHQVHDEDGGRIRYQRRCEVCEKVVKYENIDKAYDDGEHTVVLTEEDLKALPSEKSQEIDVVQFVPSEQVDPMMLERSYYLAPDSKSAKAYVLLRRTLEETNRTAIVQFSLRQKSRLGALRVRDKALVLQGLLWADEVREPDFPGIDANVRVSKKELEMAGALVEQFSEDFTPEEFEDEYQRDLRLLIEEKIKKGETVSSEEVFSDDTSTEEGEDAEVVDLMAALERSLKNKGSKSTGGKTSGGKSSGSKKADSKASEEKGKKKSA